MFRLWNAINPGMSAAESGLSYLRPCLTESDLSNRRAKSSAHSTQPYDLW
jgi:hypothetical protein